MLGNIMSGMTFGMGSAVGHRIVGGAVDAVTGGGAQEDQMQQQEIPSGSAPSYQEVGASSSANGGACALDQKQLYQCLEENGGSSGACQYYFDALKSCQSNQAQMGGSAF